MAPIEKQEKLSEFLSRWTIEEVSAMTPEQYCIGRKNSDCFTYWLDRETEDLLDIGGMGGGGAFKYGIFFKTEQKDYEVRKNFRANGEYAWDTTYGDTPELAFNTIRDRISTIIDYALAGEFNLIEQVDFHTLPKWKIAFLYSNKQLLPICDIKVLKAIAADYNIIGYATMSISQLMVSILEKKPADTNFFTFGEQLYDEFGRSAISHYVIGCKYKNGVQYDDKFDEMYTKKSVAVGFAEEHDLEELYGTSHQEISKYLYNLGEETKSVTALKHFLSLKPGDLIAIKSEGQYGLKIKAYAKVVKNSEGKIYRHDPEGLGHLISVEFLETDLNRVFDLIKGHTVHLIDDPEEIKLIFGAYAWVRDKESKANKGRRGRRGTDKKNLQAQLRVINRTVEVQMIHDKIQQAFYDKLKIELTPLGYKVEMEVDHIDVRASGKVDVIYYEVKPYHSATKCIREGLGQLMSYAALENHGKEKKLVIVGPAELEESDMVFYNFVKQQLSINITYERFTFE